MMSNDQIWSYEEDEKHLIINFQFSPQTYIDLYLIDYSP